MLKSFTVPLVSLAVIVPMTFLVIGPISDTAGKLLAGGYTGLVGLNPVIAGGILGLIWPLAVMFGVHWGFVPIVMNNIQNFGRDTLFVITGPNNMAQAGATLGVFLKTKNRDKCPNPAWHQYFNTAWIYRQRICRIFNCLCSCLFRRCSCHLPVWLQ